MTKSNNKIEEYTYVGYIDINDGKLKIIKLETNNNIFVKIDGKKHDLKNGYNFTNNTDIIFQINK